MIASDIRKALFFRTPLRVRNGQGTVIPPFAVLRIVSATKIDGELVFTVAQPNSTPQNVYLVNGPFAIGIGSTDEGRATTLCEPGYVIYSSGAPAVNQEWGPSSGSWAISDSGTGFMITGGTETMAGNTVVSAVQKGTGSTSNIVQFKLTDDLATGESAPAVVRTFNGAAYVDGEAIKVFDWYEDSGGGRGMWQGKSGMEGVAIRRAVNADLMGNPEYDIIWMEQYANAIHWEANEDMGETTAGEMEVTVTLSWDQGVEPNSTLIVHDDLDGEYTDVVAGCKGTALRSSYVEEANPTEPYYTIIYAQRVALNIQTELAANMCDGNTPEPTAITPETQGMFVESPGDSVELNNTFNHLAQQGDFARMMRVFKTKFNGKWVYEVFDVTKKVQKVITDIRWNDANKCLEEKHREIAVESCEEESDWTTIVCADPCEDS